MRIFIGIPLPESLFNFVKEKQNDFRPLTHKGNWTDPNNLHLTLLFIGEMDHDHIEHLNRHLFHDLSKEKAFLITTSELGTFKKRDESILWIGIKDGLKELNELAQKVIKSTKRADIMFKPSPFKPHITIARQIIWNQVIELNEQEIPSFTIPVDQVHLYLSHQINGKLTYTPLYTYCLQ